MIEVDVYKEGDYEEGEWRGNPEGDYDILFRTIPSFSLFWRGEIIAIFGLQKMWEGVANIVMVVSDSVKECPKEFSLESLKYFRNLSVTMKLRKIYALIDAGEVIHIKWAERMGFVREYVMVEAGLKKQDMLGYVYTLKEEN